MSPTTCAHCGNPLDITVRFDEAAIEEVVRRALQPLVRGEELIMQEIDDVKAAEDAETEQVTAIGATVGRLVTDFEALDAKVAGTSGLSDTDRADLAAIVDSAKANLAALQGTQTAVDTADPAPAAPAETPAV